MRIRIVHLDEDDGGPGDCAVDAADEVPGDVLAIRVQVLCEVVLVYLGGAVLPPAYCCLIVMRSCTTEGSSSSRANRCMAHHTR